MIVLDTHALYWMRLGSPKLGLHARQQIELAWSDDEVSVSAATFWELTMLVSKGRIQLPADVADWRREVLVTGVKELPIDGHIAIEARTLPNFRKDPADRFIVATCLRGHRLVTADRKILDWPGQLDRIDART